VTLVARTFTITFSPVSSEGRSHVTHFLFEANRGHVRGKLTVSGLTDPLPVAFDAELDPVEDVDYGQSRCSGSRRCPCSPNSSRSTNTQIVPAPDKPE
jgi:hypothetical protein